MRAMPVSNIFDDFAGEPCEPLEIFKARGGGVSGWFDFVGVDKGFLAGFFFL